jgi:hypothetical protein
MDQTPSLISAFKPPPGLRGVAALICALSGDSAIIERVLSTFTEGDQGAAISSGCTHSSFTVGCRIKSKQRTSRRAWVVRR